ncbi:unnamed protein product [Plutella xylostella]|uniref:Regulatory protein zeste n=1 Tax=Plutella xylostella TaxID=51655 RepID=A0A8S4E2W7_PLUXY|nr:unnamed protein product [Plutella xylostella]
MNSNEVSTKRSRATNFTLSEQNVLLGLIAKHRDVTLGDKVTTSSKIQTWNKICAEFQEITKVHRTSYCLRNKWDNIKRKRRLEGKFEPDELLAPFTFEDGESCTNEFTDVDESSCNSSRSQEPTPQKPAVDADIKIKSEPVAKRNKSDDSVGAQPAGARCVVLEGVPHYYAPDPLAGDDRHAPAQQPPINGRAIGRSIEVAKPVAVVTNTNMKQKLEAELLSTQLANAAAEKRRLRTQETKDKLELELLKTNLENARSARRLQLLQEEKEKIEIELLKTNLENARKENSKLQLDLQQQPFDAGDS